MGKDNIRFPARLAGLIRTLSRKYGWEPRLAKFRLWEQWEQIAGKDVARHAWPDRLLEDDTLVLVVSDSVWMQQLAFEKKLICDKINRILPEGSRIRNIRFVLGNVDRTRSRCSSRKRNHGVSRQPVSRPIPDDVLNVVEQMVEPVSDPGLRDALKKLYLKHLEKRDGS